MKHLKSLFLITFVSLCFHVAAQEGVGIGNWRTHMPYGNVIDVELLGSKVYAATNYELFTYDKDDGSIQILNKINGLSDIGISVIRRNPTLDILMVAYANANIDLIDKQGNIYNMSDIKDKNILGNKTINNVAFKGGMAYVACGFGIVVLPLFFFLFKLNNDENLKSLVTHDALKRTITIWQIFLPGPLIIH